MEDFLEMLKTIAICVTLLIATGNKNRTKEINEKIDRIEQNLKIDKDEQTSNKFNERIRQNGQ
jgi:hypothetical protein